jgi:hypothetical protein
LAQAVVDPLSLFVRWAHVGGMAAILGGALLVWWVSARPSRIDHGIAVHVAERYEWIFWGAIGLQVMTGVGNLAAFGDALPAAGSTWGTKLAVKLLAVLALAVLSVPRTLVVALTAEKGQGAAPFATGAVRRYKRLRRGHPRPRSLARAWLTLPRGHPANPVCS